jgi:hypothetical protein
MAGCSLGGRISLPRASHQRLNCALSSTCCISSCATGEGRAGRCVCGGGGGRASSSRAGPGESSRARERDISVQEVPAVCWHAGPPAAHLGALVQARRAGRDAVDLLPHQAHEVAELLLGDRARGARRGARRRARRGRAGALAVVVHLLSPPARRGVAHRRGRGAGPGRGRLYMGDMSARPRARWRCMCGPERRAWRIKARQHGTGAATAAGGRRAGAGAYNRGLTRSPLGKTSQCVAPTAQNHGLRRRPSCGGCLDRVHADHVQAAIVHRA